MASPCSSSLHDGACLLVRIERDLARLGVGVVQSTPSGEQDPASWTGLTSRERLSSPRGEPLRKAWRSLGSPTPGRGWNEGNSHGEGEAHTGARVADGHARW